MASVESENRKIPLAQYLKHLTNGTLSMSKAMGLAGKIYKSHSTPAQIRDLNDFTLQDCGITDSSDRKQVLAAFRKAGFTPIPVKPKRGTASKRARDSDGAEDSSPSTTSPSKSAGKSFSSGSPAVDAIITPPKRKRTKIVKNEFLPDGPQEEGSTLGSLEFNEVSDEAVLSSKFVVINRAPVMTAWAMVVAETMNFKREEALSIASVYTEMNAISRGVSIGLYKSGKDRGMEVSRSGSQPFVELMGRRIPLYQTQEGQWRALSNNSPVPPMTAFGYICRSFRQTTPFVIGAMKLLASSYSSKSLNRCGYSLYCDFRPDAEQWGKRSQLSCSKILSLRNEATVESSTPTAPEVVHATAASIDETQLAREQSSRPLTLEEFEAALDEDHTFDHVDLDYSRSGPRSQV